MTDDATMAANVDRLAMLTTKVERESRATRYLLVICTAANLAVTTFSMKVAWDYLPPLYLAYFLEHMPEITMTQRAYDASYNKQKAAQLAGSGAHTGSGEK